MVVSERDQTVIKNPMRKAALIAANTN